MILQQMLKDYEPLRVIPAFHEEIAVLEAVIDLIESLQVEEGHSTNPDDDPPSLMVYGNVDVPTLVTLGLCDKDVKL